MQVQPHQHEPPTEAVTEAPVGPSEVPAAAPLRGQRLVRSLVAITLTAALGAGAVALVVEGGPTSAEPTAPPAVTEPHSTVPSARGTDHQNQQVQHLSTATQWEALAGALSAAEPDWGN